MVAPPDTVPELLSRAASLSDRRMGAIARDLDIGVPDDFKRHKGWVGQVMEHALGAESGSAAAPDFPRLGVELKTLPVDARGVPLESTYVCTAPLDGSMSTRWEDAWVRRKLSHVLWVPVSGARGTSPGEREVGAPFLWQPSVEEDALLRDDWEAFRELILLGELWQIDAHLGEALQMRPKGADSKSRTWAIDDEGRWVQSMPMGFYLRASFTRTLLGAESGDPEARS
jgi:DNA mismatch repair protein MutH